MHIGMYQCMHVFICEVCACVCVCVCVCVFIQIYIQINIYIVCMYIHSVDLARSGEHTRACARTRAHTLCARAHTYTRSKTPRS
jgi:hypothetical protein